MRPELGPDDRVSSSGQQRRKRVDLRGLAAEIDNDLLQRFTSYSPFVCVKVRNGNNSVYFAEAFLP